MLHYYLQKNIPPKTILDLSPEEFAFYQASMLLEIEHQQKTI